MPVTGKIADAAKSEFPLTWDALEKAPQFGDGFLQSKIDNVVVKYVGETISVELQDALDLRVIDFLGKSVALELINAGIDYWGKQALSIGATGRNENKGYKDRSQDLILLRAHLLEQTRLMWPEVENLLPGRRVNKVARIPRVRDIENAHTADPNDFDSPFEPTL